MNINNLLPWQPHDYQQITHALLSGSQAIIMHGIQGIGKRSLAQEIIRYLLCTNKTAEGYACGSCRSCILHINNNHPDIFTIADEEGNKIKVDVIKKLLHESLSTTPSISNTKVVYIPDFQLITKQGANGLLKTLEEPSQSLVFIIVVDEISSVLPTILSRCIKINLKKPNTLQVEDYLSKTVETEPINHFWHKYFYNAPLVSPLFSDEQLQLITNCLLTPSINNILKTTEEFDGKKISFAAFIDFMYKWISELTQCLIISQDQSQKSINTPAKLNKSIFAQYSMENLLNKLSIDKLLNLQDDLHIFKEFLQHPLNYRLQIENILFNYQQCFCK